MLVAAIVPWSSTPPGSALPDGWRVLGVPNAAPAEIAVVEEAGARVLRVRSRAAAGAASFDIAGETPPRPTLSWRWKVDRVVASADLTRREGDDFAARVYVFFDIPVEELPFAARLKVTLARVLYGETLPTGGLCYVWDNRHSPGTSAWNPYTDRVRTVVLRSGDAGAGRWAEERRDLQRDFEAAFGEQWKKPMPRVRGVALGNDTDQTGEAVTAWFGDVRLEPGP